MPRISIFRVFLLRILKKSNAGGCISAVQVSGKSTVWKFGRNQMLSTTKKKKKKPCTKTKAIPTNQETRMTPFFQAELFYVRRDGLMESPSLSWRPPSQSGDSPTHLTRIPTTTRPDPRLSSSSPQVTLTPLLDVILYHMLWWGEHARVGIHFRGCLVESHTCCCCCHGGQPPPTTWGPLPHPSGPEPPYHTRNLCTESAFITCSTPCCQHSLVFHSRLGGKGAVQHWSFGQSCTLEIKKKERRLFISPLIPEVWSTSGTEWILTHFGAP